MKTLRIEDAEHLCFGDLLVYHGPVKEKQFLVIFLCRDDRWWSKNSLDVCAFINNQFIEFQAHYSYFSA